MTITRLGRIAGMLLLTGGLAACVDVDVDVNVTSQTTARVTTTQIMGADFYSMIKSDRTPSYTPGDDDFCAEGELSENPDGSATCLLVEEGPFAELTMGNENEGESVRFASAGPGLVRVSLPIQGMKAEPAAEEEMDAETRRMTEAFFAGHDITVRFAGDEVVETNMTLSADKKSAEQVLPIIDIINGTAGLPDELYAVVRVD